MRAKLRIRNQETGNRNKRNCGLRILNFEFAGYSRKFFQFFKEVFKFQYLVLD
jgi:hypothetical protein